MKNFDEFLGQFKFDPEKNLMIGVERECHLVNSDGRIAPIAQKVLGHLGFDSTGSNDGHFGYELSACQIEWRAGPCRLIGLTDNLNRDENILKQAEEKLGFTRSFNEVAPKDMPLDVYPDSTGRYQEITKNMPEEYYWQLVRLLLLIFILECLIIEQLCKLIIRQSSILMSYVKLVIIQRERD